MTIYVVYQVTPIVLRGVRAFESREEAEAFGRECRRYHDAAGQDRINDEHYWDAGPDEHALYCAPVIGGGNYQVMQAEWSSGKESNLPGPCGTDGLQPPPSP